LADEATWCGRIVPQIGLEEEEVRRIEACMMLRKQHDPGSWSHPPFLPILSEVRARALERLLRERGLDANELNWYTSTESTPPSGESNGGTGTKGNAERPSAQALPAALTHGGNEEQPQEFSLLSPASQSPVTSADHPTLADVAGLTESHAELLQRFHHGERLSDPETFKGVSAEGREQLLERVEATARVLKEQARFYRDFEAVLRWSRHF
jgi:hypothetical protein